MKIKFELYYLERLLMPTDRPVMIIKEELVKLKDNYFQHDGSLYFPIGVNYLPSSSDCRMLSEWNIKEIEEDFSYMKRLGINTIRFFIFGMTMNLDRENTMGNV